MKVKPLRSASVYATLDPNLIVSDSSLWKSHIMQWASLRTWTRLACPREKAWQDGLLRGVLAIQSRNFCSIGLGAAAYRQPPASMARIDFFIFCGREVRILSFCDIKKWHVWLGITILVYCTVLYCMLFLHPSGANWGLTVLLSYPWRSQIHSTFECAQCLMCSDLISVLIALGLPSGMAFYEAFMNSLEAKTPVEEWLRPCWPWCSTTRRFVTDSTGENGWLSSHTAVNSKPNEKACQSRHTRHHRTKCLKLIANE